MPTSPTFVIVGGGLAGAKAAETLRAEGFGGRILVLAVEAERPVDPDRLADPDIPLVALASEQDGHRLGVRSP